MVRNVNAGTLGDINSISAITGLCRGGRHSSEPTSLVIVLLYKVFASSNSTYHIQGCNVSAVIPAMQLVLEHWCEYEGYRSVDSKIEGG